MIRPTDGTPFPSTRKSMYGPTISAAGWIRIVYLGAFASAGSYVFYNRALRDLEASQVGAFVNLVPVIGAVSGVVVLRETIAPLAMLGGALVIGGVWIASRGSARGD